MQDCPQRHVGPVRRPPFLDTHLSTAERIWTSAERVAKKVQDWIKTSPLKALTRGYRWRKLLRASKFTATQEVARTDKITPSYVKRVRPMPLRALQIAEAIRTGHQPAGLTGQRRCSRFRQNAGIDLFYGFHTRNVGLAMRRGLLYSRRNPTQSTSFIGAR